MYSLYSIPNIVIPLIGGILIDKKGPRIVMILTAFICVLGQSVVSFGGFYNKFNIMLIGRALFGVGG